MSTLVQVVQGNTVVSVYGPGVALAMAAADRAEEEADRAEAEAEEAAASAAAAAVSAAAALSSEENAGNYLDGVELAVAGLDITDILPLQATSRAILAAFTGMAAGRQALLSEAGREGLFVWSTADNSANVTGDPLQGIYVPPASDTDGSSGAWVRRYTPPLRAEWFGATGDGVTDDIDAINAACAVGSVELLPKTYAVGSAVIVLFGLIGAGIDRTKIRPVAGFDRAIPAMVVTPLDSVGVTISDLTIDAEKMNNGLGDGLRTHGLMFQRAFDFTAERLHVLNVYGYAIYHENPHDGATWNDVYGARGKYIGCHVENSQVCFEATGLDGLQIEDCHGRGGDEDVAQAEMFTFYSGCKNVMVRACTGIGAGLIAKPDSTGNASEGGVDMENIVFENCFFKRTGVGHVFFVEGGNFIHGLHLVGCTFISEGYHAAYFNFCSGTITGCTIRAASDDDAVSIIGIEMQTDTKMSVSGTEIYCDVTGAGQTATGVQSSNPLPFAGGRIECTSDTGQAIPTAGSVAISPSTIIVPAGRTQATRTIIQGQASIITSEAGVSSVADIELSFVPADASKFFFSCSIRAATDIFPAAAASFYVFFSAQFIHVNILGDHGGKTLMWELREIY